MNAFCFCNLITNFLILVALYTSGVVSHESKHILSRKSFPPGFTFGSSSSAYQYEGAAFEGGKGPSIWDTFSHKHKEKIADGSNGDVAVDQYHRYQQDVKLMKSIGLDAYRFSISWPRILPTGSIKGGINKEGLNYYHNLIDSLVSRGLKPFVTLFHWDVPQALEDEYGGFLSPKIVEDYANFVDVCFREFGDKVKHWITLNEPLIFASFGYATGTLAPGRCSRLVGDCSAGDSGREPYVVGHNQLLAHAAAVKLYKGKYQDSQKGVIGITLASNWVLPYGPTASDKDARQRAIDFTLGWYMDPLTRGMYPKSMRSLVKDRLPRFTKEEAQLVQGSFDFIGLNYYTTSYAIGVRPSNNMVPNYSTDYLVNSTSQRNGVPIGPRGASSWLYMYPQGLRDLLVYTKTKYNNPIIYITENGIDEFNNASLPLKEALKDPLRIEYHAGHLAYVLKALSKGVDVRGYFVWSFLDNYEWNSGYTVRFGINFVDYSNGLRRYPKKSALWFKSFLRR